MLRVDLVCKVYLLLSLTAADVHDALAMTAVLNIHTEIAVGDSYGASKVRVRSYYPPPNDRAVLQIQID